MKIGERITIYRKRSGQTQEELAGKLDKSVMTIRRWEKGERKPRVAISEPISRPYVSERRDGTKSNRNKILAAVMGFSALIIAMATFLSPSQQPVPAPVYQEPIPPPKEEPVLAPAKQRMSDEEFLELCQRGTPEQIRAAIKGGANTNARSKARNTTALMFAARYNANHEVIDILIKTKVDVNARNDYGSTALTMAAGNTPNPEVVAILLEAKAIVDIQAKPHGLTALMAAVKHTHRLEIIDMLLGAGADVNLKDNSGKRAIDYVDDNKEIKNFRGTSTYRKLRERSR